MKQADHLESDTWNTGPTHGTAVLFLFVGHNIRVKHGETEDPLLTEILGVERGSQVRKIKKALDRFWMSLESFPNGELLECETSITVMKSNDERTKPWFTPISIENFCYTDPPTLLFISWWIILIHSMYSLGTLCVLRTTKQLHVGFCCKLFRDPGRLHGQPSVSPCTQRIGGLHDASLTDMLLMKPHWLIWFLWNRSDWALYTVSCTRWPNQWS